MSKRIGGILLLALSAAALAFFARLSLGVSRLSDCRASNASLDALVAAREPAREPLLGGLSFDGLALMADEAEGLFFYSLPADDPGARDPAVRFAAREPGVRVAVEDAAIDDALIRENRALRLLAYTDDAYTEYRVCVTTLPLLSISCGETVGLEPARVEIALMDNRPGAQRRLFRSAGTMHTRGATVSLFPKKSYRLTLLRQGADKAAAENDYPMLGLRADGDWILYACYDDQEKARAVLSSRLWYDTCAADNAFGIRNGMTYAYVELFLDGRYWGLYALGFPVDAKQQRLTDGEVVAKVIDWWDAYDGDFSHFNNADVIFSSKAAHGSLADRTARAVYDYAVKNGEFTSGRVAAATGADELMRAYGDLLRFYAGGG